MTARRSLTILLLCFFLSGATGLVYEVIWLRMLGLVFGHTVYAITTVLAAFMAGLALGSFVFARLAARIRNLIAVYGWLEIGIGVYCALIPLLLGATSAIYLGLHRMLGFSYDAFSLVQFLLIFVLLLVPTSLMGGTLPVLSQALVRDDATLGRAVGALYATNTFGAVLGVVMAGYVLLPAIGIRMTITVAVLGNLAVGALALAYSRRVRLGAATSPAWGPRNGPHTPQRSSRPGEAVARLDRGVQARLLTILAFGVSGAVSMIYEVAWTRALALVIGSSTYAFTSMLLAFLVGIAGGSALYSWLSRRGRSSPRGFAMIQLGIGVTMTGVVLIFERMPELFLNALAWSDSARFMQLAQFAVSAGVLLPSTLFIGATFPSAVAVAARAVRAGHDVGNIYAVNTLGAIAGTVLTGWLLVPTLGVHGSLELGIALNFLLAALLFAASPASKPLWRWAPAAIAIVGAIAVLLIPAWDQRVMSAGPAVYGKTYLTAAKQSSLAEVLRRQKVLYYREGRSSTVSVDQDGPFLFLRNNGKMDAGTAVDMPTQVLLGHLAMLVHPDPKRVLVIGLGSGITAGGVVRHPVERVDIAEIEPAVVEASRFFAQYNGDVLKDPRVHTVIADARNLLVTSPNRYDVIISEPSNPWVSGLAALFSVEFFQMARDHVQPDGLVLQWLHGYNLNPEDFRMVVNTFRSVFPSVTMWNTIPGDFLLLGSMRPAPLDLGRLQRRFQQNPGVWRDFDRFGIQMWPGVLGYFMLGDADTARFAAGGGLNTDDRLPLEFSAPRALYLDTVRTNWNLAHDFKRAELPDVTPESQRYLRQADVHFEIAVGYWKRELYPDCLVHLRHALEIDPNHMNALVGMAGVHARLRQPTVALDFARRALARDPRSAAASYLAGVSSSSLNMKREALALLQQAVALDPKNRDYQATLQQVMNDGRRQ